jgi:hypothetical protein
MKDIAAKASQMTRTSSLPKADRSFTGLVLNICLVWFITSFSFLKGKRAQALADKQQQVPGYRYQQKEEYP